MKDRLHFKKGEQRAFLETIKLCSCQSWKSIASILGVHDRTLRDWGNEKYVMSYGSAQKLSRKYNVSIPKNTVVEKWGLHLKEAGRKGGVAHVKKYGRVKVNEKIRKEKWRKWWEEKGRYQDHPLIGKTLPLEKPTKSEKLAEFVGIVLGDGSISKRQVTIYLNSEDDKEYGKFVSSLAKKLFKVPVGIHQRKSCKCTNYIISRTDLVCYLTEEFGMKTGNKVKQQVDIPDWIKHNKRYAHACVRGLIDTDGCFFTHKYIVGGKQYSYKKISYSSRSKPLLKSVYLILKESGIKSRLTERDELWLDSKESTRKYFDLIGTSNPKHLNKFKN